MAYALQGGVLSQLSFGINASVAALKEKLKGLSLKSSFVGGRIEIADDWPNVSNLAGVLLLQDDNLRIVGEGDVDGVYMPDFTAKITDWRHRLLPLCGLTYRSRRRRLSTMAKSPRPSRPSKKTLKILMIVITLTAEEHYHYPLACL